ncbi:acetylglutamate kinase [Thermicanus aegyptius]|uniref:acetylglutamate kinase n=1 Tax=Thermicanus aegyptius TaxID=94009 RepID=UPI000587E844|nr:acetylglutamate kinase [Thermicanus aegyptius]
MKSIVIKLGGSILNEIPDAFYEQIVLFFKEGKIKPILIHGGGPAITDVLNRFDVPTRFVQGIRYTDEETVEIVEMVLSGAMNKKLVRKIIQAGGKAMGLSGVDGGLFLAEQVDDKERLGLVGKIVEVKREWLDLLLDQGVIPVISPLSLDASSRLLNVNADQAAAKVAEIYGGRLIYVSDIPGILVQKGEDRQILHEATAAEILRYISEGEITGGMIPKVETALAALSQGASEAIIIDGHDPQALGASLLGEKVGTRIRWEEKSHASATHGDL